MGTAGVRDGQEPRRRIGAMFEQAERCHRLFDYIAVQKFLTDVFRWICAKAAILGATMAGSYRVRLPVWYAMDMTEVAFVGLMCHKYPLDGRIGVGVASKQQDASRIAVKTMGRVKRECLAVLRLPECN